MFIIHESNNMFSSRMFMKARVWVIDVCLSVRSVLAVEKTKFLFTKCFASDVEANSD